MASPGHLARPARELRDRPLPTILLPKSHPVFRLHDARFAPMHFGASGDNRFDAPDGRFGILYLAQQIPGAFVEVFCRQRQRWIAETALARFHMSEFHSSRDLQLVDLAGKGLVQMGLDARICTGDYRLAQQWADAFHEHPDQVDGVFYVSRHDPEQKLMALFDRTQPLLTVRECGPFHVYMGDDLFSLLNRYDMALL